MIVRHLIVCETCETSHTLRIQVGHEPYQEHTCHCVECEEEIVVGMDCNQAEATVKVHHIENCKLGTVEGTVINLSSGFPISREDLHRDMAFPSIEQTEIIRGAQEALGIQPKVFASLEEARASALQAQSINELWPILKRGWSLTNKGKLDLASSKFNDYGAGEFPEPRELQYVLFDFCIRMLSPTQRSLFENAASECSEISRKQPKKFHAFKEYFSENMAADNKDRYFETFKEYFACFTDFSQTMIHLQHGIAIPPDFDASSHAFSKTKLFYGNAFETLTSNVAVLACLNNISNGRHYDQFESMDLKKYLTINKANRANPFKGVDAFRAITDCLDSTIRNASHHRAMASVSKGRTIRYQSGGNGAVRTMSYLEYINLCNEIMLSSSALLALELMIGF